MQLQLSTGLRSSPSISSSNDAGKTRTLEANPTLPYSKETEVTIKAALHSDPSPWQELKKYGEKAFAGQAAQAADRLFEAFEKPGIVLVRDGQLERLAPTVQSTKGAAWLTEALKTKAHQKAPAQAHIDHVVQAIEHRLGKQTGS